MNLHGIVYSYLTLTSFFVTHHGYPASMHLASLKLAVEYPNQTGNLLGHGAILAAQLMNIAVCERKIQVRDVNLWD